MQIRRNEITTGLLVVVTFCIVLAVLIVVGMPGLIQPINTYRIYYDNAKGLRTGAPVLLAGREVGKVVGMDSPVPPEKRPPGHPDDEVSIDVQIPRKVRIYRDATVHLTAQGMMGQETIDFVHGTEAAGLATDHTEFVGDRVPDIGESLSDDMKALTGPNSDLAQAIRNAKTFIETLNNARISETISNLAQLTDTLKKQPWRLVWPSSKPVEPPPKPAKKK
jgi:ABC-type transporter Mla subunit MlaD